MTTCSPPSKRLRTTSPYNDDTTTLYALSLVIFSGMLHWHVLERFKCVSKQFRRDIAECRDDLPVWKRIIEYIDKKNGLNKCLSCHEPFQYACTCGKNNNNQGDPYSACSCAAAGPIQCCREEFHERTAGAFGAPSHPRLQPGFALLSNYEKATQLMKFHQLCIKNLLSFYDSKLETSYYFRGPPFYHTWGPDGFFGFEELQMYNPKAYGLLCTVAELQIAESDLSGDAFHFGEAFAGIRCDPACGSSFNQSMIYTMSRLVQQGEKRSDEEETVDSDGYGSWAVSQIRHLDATLFCAIRMRELEAYHLFGPEVADTISVFQDAREHMDFPTLNDAFPLQWMPMFGGDKDTYDPNAESEDSDSFYSDDGDY